jgi:hypothetical protein
MFYSNDVGDRFPKGLAGNGGGGLEAKFAEKVSDQSYISRPFILNQTRVEFKAG